MIYTKKEVKEATLEYFNNDELAANVWLTKYGLKNTKGEFVEKTPDDMHIRLANEFARMEKSFGGDSTLSQDEIYNLLKDFKYIVPQGSPMMGIGNDYVNVSLSNCGVGLDISRLRPEGTPVNNSAGTTTGAWSFADFYSYVCRMIGQNGRRGALMITMDIKHPDIQKFVTMKNDLTKVTGANVSVKISDEFMHAVEGDQDFELCFPVDSKDPKYKTQVKARELWDLIVDSATKTAEPGLMMWDNIINNLPAHCYKDQGFETLTTNPCGEIPLSAYDSCRLISINLKNFVSDPFKNPTFDYEKLYDVASKAMRLSDDLVELEVEKLNRILAACDTEDERSLWQKLLRACIDGRRTGLGTHGLADAIACMNLRYDSEEAVKTIDIIYKTIRNAAYTESVNLAKDRGAFEVFDWEKEKDNDFIKKLPQDIRDAIQKFGRRNISILTNAPTGSVSIMSQTSSGLEPDFRNSYIRRRKLSHNERNVEPDFVDDLGDRWLEYDVFHHNVQDWLDLNNIKSKDTELPDIFVESSDIDWQKRIEVQASIQNNIDHSISSTINLPKGTPPSVVAELYMLGWKLGLKGITVYVDGSRTGVLVSEREGKIRFPQSGAPKRPSELFCDIHHTTIQGEKWTILVGIYDGKPYEVLGGLSNLIEIPKRYTTGRLTKHSFKTKTNRYDLTFGETDNEIFVRDVVKVFDNPNNSAFTRMISLSLRHGARPSFLVEQLQKDKGSDMFSFARCLSRILKNYIQDGEVVENDKSCDDCGEEGLIYQDGCVTCSKCGYAKCG